MKELLDHRRTRDLEQLQQSEYQYAPLLHSGQPEIPLLTKLPPETDEQQMWDDFELDRSNTSILGVNSTDRLDPTEQQEAEFYRALDRAKMNFDPTGWGFEEFGIQCDVDETLTNVMQNLGQS